MVYELDSLSGEDREVFEREKLGALDEIDSMEKFFDVSIEEPEFVPTKGRNGIIPSRGSILIGVEDPEGVAGARSLVHYNVIEEVVERNESEVEDYFEDELLDLSPRKLPQKIKQRLSIDKGIEDISEQVLQDDLHPAEGIMRINSISDVQTDVFAEDGRADYFRILGSAATAGGLLTAISGHGLYTQGLDYMMQDPYSASIGVVGAGITGMAAKGLYDIAPGEPLTTRNMVEYDTEDCQRAMLYNSQICNDIDGYLEILDEYGIE